MYYTSIDTKMGKLLIVGDEKGIRNVDFQGKRGALKIDNNWIEDKDNEVLKDAVEQLEAYFDGSLEEFDLPLAPVGTPFQESVWGALTEIPYGKLASYKDIAEKIDNPKAARAIGGANNKNPISIIIPCHRVIGANGYLVGYGGGLSVKQYLLNLEGIEI
ncbi:MAG TPA: methylated-DNA--[protein]-cysteine S-methyltransferase [Victivallales bacterium]|nr:methylated-DNA--[protein]-cysteine S-methyltransferase [Victivallales bacterium]